SIEAAWNTARDEGGHNLGYKIRYKEGYFPVPPMDHYHDLRSEMILTMERLGIEVEIQHHEVGTAGQAEIDMRFDTMLRIADKLMLYKHIVKHEDAHARKALTLQVRRQDVGACRRQVGHVHAEADLPGQRVGHALPPVV